MIFVIITLKTVLWLHLSLLYNLCPRHRQEVIRQIYEGLNTGGGFIFAEKTVCQDPRLQNMMTFNYYDYKRQNFDTEDIMDKEKTLRHMMKPNTWNEIIDNLCEGGFWGDKIQINLFGETIHL